MSEHQPVADCLFCQIVAGKAPAKVVYTDDETLGFVDIRPQAPVHLLLIPKRHFTDIADLSTDAAASLAVVRGINALAESQGLSQYRTVFNRGPQSGQTVYHVHAHVLGGRRMTWPPG